MQDTVAATLATVAGITPGHRLVPAKVGRRNDTSTNVYIECPTWCVIDHVNEPEVHVEDVDHSTLSSDVTLHSFDRPGLAHVLMAMLKTDPASPDFRLRQAHVLVDDEREVAFLTPETAEQFADELIGFASEVRHLARAARLHNRTVAGSSPTNDVDFMPIDGLLKRFGVTVVENDGSSVELAGEPGDMQLRVGRTVPQRDRDSEARRLLAEYASEASRA
ncbi:hypothetical protein ABZ341_32545 [Streptomyces sp. NPDC006173]|uniref:DUF6907 domain-containing protein n=1 Tax=Streptomyces sp. NPDC006173 TaxID=3155349 RepID=UPI0033EC3CEF